MAHYVNPYTNLTPTLEKAHQLVYHKWFCNHENMSITSAKIVFLIFFNENSIVQTAKKYNVFMVSVET